MTFFQWVQAHSGVIIAGLIIVFGAMTRALPAQSSDFKVGQFIIDWLKGIAQMLPSTAPKLTTAQKMAIHK